MASVIDMVLKLRDEASRTLQSVNRGLGDTIRMQRKVAKDYQSIGKSVTGVATTMAPAAAVIAGGVGLAAKSFVDFEATMTIAGSKAGATAKELENLKKQGMDLGKEFPVSASDVAVSMDQLASSGFNATQIMGTMPAILKASTASGAALANTADVISSTLAVFDMTTGDVAKNAAHCSDVIQMMANKSKMNMEGFGVALSYVGPSAKGLKISVEQLGTAMAILANKGMDASTIGTSLRGILTNVADTTSTAGKTLAALGVSVKDANGNFIGLEAMASKLRVAMAGMSDTEKVSTATAIAGKNAQAALLSLISTAPDEYRALGKAIEHADGSSEAAFNKMKKTSKYAIDSLKGSLESLGLSIGNMVAPALISVANSIGSVIDFLNNLPGPIKSVMLGLGGMVVGLTATMFAVGKTITAYGAFRAMLVEAQVVMEGGVVKNKLLQYSIQGVQYAFANFGTVVSRVAAMSRMAFTTMLGPVGLAIGAVALGAYLIYKNWDRIKEVFKPIVEMLNKHLTKAISFVMEKVELFKKKIISISDTPAIHALVNAFKKVYNIVSMIIDQGLTDYFEVLSGVVTTVAGVVCGIMGGMFNSIAAAIGMVIDVLGGLITFITGVFTGDWQMAWDGIKQIFAGAFEGIKGICLGVLDGIKAAVNAVIAGINNIHVNIPDWVPMVGGKGFGPLNIPMLATGTDNWGGGPAMIHDKGAEIVDLPSGTRVIPHDPSIKTAYQQGKRDSDGGAKGVTININGVNINGDQDVRDLAYKVASAILYEMKKHGINMAEGAV